MSGEFCVCLSAIVLRFHVGGGRETVFHSLRAVGGGRQGEGLSQNGDISTRERQTRNNSLCQRKISVTCTVQKRSS